MTIHTSVSTIGERIVIAVDGPVDLASIGTLYNDLGRVIRQHPGQRLFVDLDGITTLDDAGLGVLLGVAALARDAGGDLEIVCSQPALRARFDRTRFDRAVTVLDRLDGGTP